MAGITTTDHAVKVGIGAVLGGTVLVALAPVLLPVAVFGAAAAAVTVGVGTVIGAGIGYVAGAPSEEKIVQLLMSPQVQSLMSRGRR